MSNSVQINPNTESDWELVTELFRAKPRGSSQIPRFDLDVELNADFIAVEAFASNQRSTWASGGFLSQVYRFDEFELTSSQYFVVLNQINLIRVNRPAPIAYRLVFDPPKYFVDATVRVWQYNGIQTDLLLQEIALTLQNISVNANVDLREVDDKLNRILANQNGNVAVDLSEVNSKLDAILDRLTAEDDDNTESNCRKSSPRARKHYGAAKKRTRSIANQVESTRSRSSAN